MKFLLGYNNGNCNLLGVGESSGGWEKNKISWEGVFWEELLPGSGMKMFLAGGGTLPILPFPTVGKTLNVQEISEISVFNCLFDKRGI